MKLVVNNKSKKEKILKLAGNLILCFIALGIGAMLGGIWV